MLMLNVWKKNITLNGDVIYARITKQTPYVHKAPMVHVFIFYSYHTSLSIALPE